MITGLLLFQRNQGNISRKGGLKKKKVKKTDKWSLRMAQTYTAFMKSRAKKQRAGTFDPGVTFLKVGDREMVPAAKKPKKKKQFQEYMENWSLHDKKRRKRSATDLSDHTGGARGVITTTGTIQPKRVGKDLILFKQVSLIEYGQEKRITGY